MECAGVEEDYGGQAGQEGGEEESCWEEGYGFHIGYIIQVFYICAYII